MCFIDYCFLFKEPFVLLYDLSKKWQQVTLKSPNKLSGSKIPRGNVCKSNTKTFNSAAVLYWFWSSPNTFVLLHMWHNMTQHETHKPFVLLHIRQTDDSTRTVPYTTARGDQWVLNFQFRGRFLLIFGWLNNHLFYCIFDQHMTQNRKLW